MGAQEVKEVVEGEVAQLDLFALRNAPGARLRRLPLHRRNPTFRAGVTKTPRTKSAEAAGRAAKFA